MKRKGWRCGKGSAEKTRSQAEKSAYGVDDNLEMVAVRVG